MITYKEVQVQKDLSTVAISQWIASEEHNPASLATPHESLAQVIRRIEAVAYAKGLRDGLGRLELITAIVPKRGLSVARIIQMAKAELASAIHNWLHN